MVRISKSALSGHAVRQSRAVVLAGLVVAGVVGTASAQGHVTAGGNLKKLAGSGSATISKAAAKKGSGSPVSQASAKPTQVGTYGDWGVYVSQGARSKICYALAQPKAKSPAGKRDQTYVFISNRPGEGVRNEVSIIMGTALKDGAAGARAEIGSTGFDLIAKGQNAFVKNAAEEGQFVDTLKKRGSRLVIKVPPAKGAVLSDTYSLSGIGQALDRVAKECP